LSSENLYVARPACDVAASQVSTHRHRQDNRDMYLTLHELPKIKHIRDTLLETRCPSNLDLQEMRRVFDRAFPHVEVTCEPFNVTFNAARAWPCLWILYNKDHFVFPSAAAQERHRSAVESVQVSCNLACMSERQECDVQVEVKPARYLRSKLCMHMLSSAPR